MPLLISIGFFVSFFLRFFKINGSDCDFKFTVLNKSSYGLVMVFLQSFSPDGTSMAELQTPEQKGSNTKPSHEL